LVITHLSLSRFRNYRALELDLPQGVLVFQGDNAQGKSNLLEAPYLLATIRSHRAENERELLSFSSQEPWARVVAEAHTSQGRLLLEMVIQEVPSFGMKKRLRVNGVPRSASALVGLLAQALFSPEDIVLVGGPPALRRRFLDILGSQMEGRYLFSLRRYQKVLAQRNHLLRLTGEGKAGEGELVFWDKELVASGSFIIQARRRLVEALSPRAQEAHRALAEEDLSIRYQPFVDEASFSRALEEGREKEVGAGMTLVGPHRDDLLLEVGGVEAGAFASRGQQRTIALSLRLGEGGLLWQKRGESPVLLLDDVFSELDAPRRGRLLQAVVSYQQVFITTTDLDRLPPELVSQATLYQIRAGTVQRL
jgi:DNA replication and repair protein RecF